MTVEAVDWRPTTNIVQVNGVGDVEVVDAEELTQTWPILPTGAAHLDITTRIRGRPASVLVRVLEDQGRAVDPKSAKKLMGRGIKLACAVPGASGLAAPVPGNTRLLPFVIVAKAPALSHDATALEAVYTELRSRGVGAGEYLTLESGKQSFIYDTARSAAHLANTPLLDKSRGKAKTSTTLNLDMTLPTSQPEVFTGWWKTKKKASLSSGAPLWGAYGSGSPINKEIRKAQAERQKNSPKVNSQRAAMHARLAKVRAAKLEGRACESRVPGPTSPA